MLLNIHVKNLALIDEVNVEFKDHLNILTGETGAGKSVLIGSVAMALGGRVSKDMIRKGADEALAELIFSVNNAKIMETLRQLDIPVEDETVIISRKVTKSRNICRINGEIVSLAALKTVGGLLMDLHGQHENQSLLDESRHIILLDRFLKKDYGAVFDTLAEAYSAYSRLKEEAKNAMADKETRMRELSFIRFELDEIESSHLMNGEDTDLEASYRKMLHSRQIGEASALIHQCTGYESDNSAGEQLGRALKSMYGIEDYDEALLPLREQMENVESLLNDFNRDLSAYMDNLTFDEEDFKQTEERLDLINRLKAKYGSTIEEIKAYQEKQQKILEKLNNYEEYLEELQSNLKDAEDKIKKISLKVHELRSNAALPLQQSIENALKDLNFLDVRFEIQIKKTDEYSKMGLDKVVFMISTNPGEDLKPLSQIASGGELSRMMLAVKSVLADIDEIHTLIFDEIDAGISGRTAQKVAEKLASISRNHQVLCITHLPQIAAMAQNHYLIEKHLDKDRMLTEVHELTDAGKVKEIGRLLGGVEITKTVLDNACEMKKMAEQFRKTCLK